MTGDAIVRTVARALRFPVASPSSPHRLGADRGRFTAPAPPSNAVSSQSTVVASRAAPFGNLGSREITLDRAIAALEREPGCRIVVRRDDYLHAECETRMMRFVDDVELVWDDAASVLHVRSSSRVGRSDLGANRARVERLRERLQAP